MKTKTLEELKAEVEEHKKTLREKAEREKLEKQLADLKRKTNPTNIDKNLDKVEKFGRGVGDFFGKLGNKMDDMADNINKNKEVEKKNVRKQKVSRDEDERRESRFGNTFKI